MYLAKSLGEHGKIFEEQFKKSSEKVDGVFFYRIKDVPPTALKSNARVSRNLYDSFMYKHPVLYALELKSVDASHTKSISFQSSSEDKNTKNIKWHQIEALKHSAETYGIIAGLVLNFRFSDHEETYFIHINSFLVYKDIAENGRPNPYNCKINRASIPIAVCREIGIGIESYKPRIKYLYNLEKFIDDLSKKYKY